MDEGMEEVVKKNDIYAFGGASLIALCLRASNDRSHYSSY